jgi:hypothetical protein
MNSGPCLATSRGWSSPESQWGKASSLRLLAMYLGLLSEWIVKKSKEKSICRNLHYWLSRGLWDTP